MKESAAQTHRGNIRDTAFRFRQDFRGEILNVSPGMKSFSV